MLPDNTFSSNHQVLGAKILQVLIDLAKIAPTLEQDKVHAATFDNLQQALPREHRDDFNQDMTRCINISGVHQFSLAPEVVATNILPHYANFLASMIFASHVNYRPTGCPVSLKIEVDASMLATATIQWAYSMVEAIDVELPAHEQG